MPGSRPRGAPTAPAHDILSVSPASGAATDTIRISSPRLRATPTVTIGGNAATITASRYGLWTASDGYPYVDVTAPAHADGAVDVVVVSDGISDTAAGAFTYAAGGSTVDAIFRSDWSTATGQTSAAFLDTNKAAPWTSTPSAVVNSAVESVATAGLDADWPTANAMVIRASAGNLNTFVTVRDMGTPVDGTHRYFRVYVAMLWTDDHGNGTSGNLEHGIESAPAETGSGQGMNPFMVPRSNGTWFPGYREISTSYRWVADSLSLTKNATYRFEWHITYGATTYTIEIRIYDGDGVLVATAADFVRSVPSPAGELLSAATLTLSDKTDHRWFRVGTNGPSSNFPLSNIDANDAFRAHGAVAISEDDWCGAYGNVTGES